ncbi:MAG: hypothetical protein IJU08_06130 [Bacteroidales bacterium]|nr:hypothetical protein [Bacteroidales bacterium]
MKRHIILLAAVFAAALLATGCEPEEINGPKNEGLTISLFSDEPETKAFDPTFESVIDHFDFFFFEDEAGTQPIAGMHGRATGSSTTLATGKNDTYAALRKRASYVYILANYPGTISHSADHTLAELLALPVDHKIVTAKATEINPINGDVEETGEVTFNANLVMDSYHKDGTTEKHTVKIDAPRSVNEARTVTVGLTRLAAKLQMIVNVEPSVTGSLGGEVWTPVLRDLKVYYVNALNNKTTVAGTPIQRSTIPAAQQGSYEYLSYPVPYPLTVDGTDDHKFTTDPAFTYPQTWAPYENGDPYFKIQMTWSSNLRGTSPFYYKVRVPHTATGGFCTLERNKCYTVTVNLAVVDTDSDYVELNGSYVVTPWIEGLQPGGDGMSAARFFNVPVKEFTMYSDTTLTIPVYSSSTVSAYFDEISYTHYGAASTSDGTFSYPYSFTYGNEGDNNILLPTSDVLPAAQDPNRYKLTVADNNKSVTFEHKLNKVFTIRDIVLTIKNKDGKSEIVTIHQHPAIEIRKIKAKNAFVNGHFARNDKDTRDAEGNLMGEMYGPTQAYDTGLYKYISHEHQKNASVQLPGGGYPKTIDLSSYGMGNIYSDWKASVHAAQVFMVEITVSAFNETNKTYKMKDTDTGETRVENFMIGDPRVKASEWYTSANGSEWSLSNTTNFWLPDYLTKDSYVRTSGSEEAGWAHTTRAFEHGSWSEPLKVLIASQGTDARNVIAPKFLISSTLNGMNPGCRFDGSVRRAATYQENGYPAGRWRLPTEAEIAFIVACQRDGLIPELYVNGTTKYWCANRSYVVMQGSSAENGINITPDATNTIGFNRFVYDLWYWGDEPMDPDYYHPNQHEH